MIKKLCLLSLLATSIHNVNASSLEENAQKPQEMEAPLPWNTELQKKQKTDRQELQRRPSFKALKETREREGPSSVFQGIQHDDKFVDEQKNRSVFLKKLQNNEDYKQLAILRSERNDFDLDEKNKKPRMDDIKADGDAEKILANQLRGADKYISYLQQQVIDLGKENDDLKNKLANKNISNEDQTMPLSNTG